jgi:hypothetical protein
MVSMSFTAGGASTGRHAAEGSDLPAADRAPAGFGPSRPVARSGGPLPRRADTPGLIVPAVPNAEPVDPEILHRVLDSLQEL